MTITRPPKPARIGGSSRVFVDVYSTGTSVGEGGQSYDSPTLAHTQVIGNLYHVSASRAFKFGGAKHDTVLELYLPAIAADGSAIALNAQSLLSIDSVFYRMKGEAISVNDGRQKLVIEREEA